MKIFDELKRRNVIKATMAYIVVSWVLWQVITSVLPYFGAPPWVLKTLMFLMAIGLPIWIIFSWVYEITPEGLKKTVKVSKDQSITEATNKRLNIIIILTLIIAIVVAFVNKPMPNTSSKTIVSDDLMLDNSIAVIPFKNLSDNRENQYFADGMMDDILNQLSIIEGLEVKSRQSSERYHESVKSVQQIGAELGANYLLEGSVQKHMDSIRIIVQLIDAINDKHLWSDKYDFELKNVFTIQSEISKQIANELNTVISLTGIEAIKKNPTENLEAYNLYLKGRFFWHRRTEEDLNKSIYYFNKALELDSTYAKAYAGLADAYFVMWWRKAHQRKEGNIKAMEFAKKALSFDNTIAEAHATIGGVLCYQKWKWKEAEKELKIALSLNPNYATAHQYYAELLEILGKNKEAREQIDLALILNPNSFMMHIYSARFYQQEGLFDKALVEANKAKEINENHGWAYWIIFEIYSKKGMNDEAIAEMEAWWNLERNIEMAIGSREAYNNLGIKGVYKYINDYDLKMGYAHNQPYKLAQKYAFLDEKEKALEWLEMAFEQHSLRIPLLNSDPYFENLRSEPRFKAILKKMGLEDK